LEYFMSKIILDGSAFADPIAALDAWQAGAALIPVTGGPPWSITDSELIHRRRFVYIRIANGDFTRIVPDWEK
jgi:hypothetical protein